MTIDYFDTQKDESSDIQFTVDASNGIDSNDFSLTRTEDQVSPGGISRSTKLVLEYTIASADDFNFTVNLSNDIDGPVTLDVDVTVEDTSPPIIDEIGDETINEDGSLNINFNVTSNTPSVYDDVVLSNISNGNQNHILTSLSGDVDNGYNLIITPVDDWNGTLILYAEK